MPARLPSGRRHDRGLGLRLRAVGQQDPGHSSAPELVGVGGPALTDHRSQVGRRPGRARAWPRSRKKTSSAWSSTPARPPRTAPTAASWARIAASTSTSMNLGASRRPSSCRARLQVPADQPPAQPAAVGRPRGQDDLGRLGLLGAARRTGRAGDAASVAGRAAGSSGPSPPGGSGRRTSGASPGRSRRRPGGRSGAGTRRARSGPGGAGFRLASGRRGPSAGSVSKAVRAQTRRPGSAR